MQKKVIAESKNGFTLTELIMVVAVIGIIGAIATPGIMNWLPNMRLTAGARDLYSTLQKAKIEAVRRNQICVLVFNQTISGTNFSYVLFEDQDGDIEFDATEPVISQVQQLPKSVSFDISQGSGDGLSFADNDDSNPAIGFSPTTLPIGNGGVLSNGTAWLENNNRSLRVVVNRAGSVSIR